MIRQLILLGVAVLIPGAPVRAQEPSSVPPPHVQKPEPGTLPSQLPQQPDPQRLTMVPESHRFFHKENTWLFAGVAMARTSDFVSTRNFRGRGRDEILLNNHVVDNTPGFVAVQAGGVATSIALSYLFHRKGHHKLERWVSILHISVSGFGAVRNFMLESRRAPATPP